MEDLSIFLQDDVEAKFLALQNKKKRRKRRRRKYKIIAVLVIVFSGFLYFKSDVSKVKSFEVKGNVFYSKEKVLKKANLSYDTRYIAIPKIYFEWKLKKDPFIEEASVTKSLDGSITIRVKEKTIIGYFVEKDKNYVLASDGSKIELTSANLTSIVKFPLLDGFSAEESKKLAAAFVVKDNEVEESIIGKISEIHPYTSSYDEHMVKIIMQDGNSLFSSYDSIYLLNDYYSKIIKNVKGNDVCMIMDSATLTYLKVDCATLKEK